MLGSFFYGYVLTQIPGGILADWVGGRHVIGFALALSAFATLFIPLAAEHSFYAVCGLRFIIGFVEVSSVFLKIKFELTVLMVLIVVLIKFIS